MSPSRTSASSSNETPKCDASAEILHSKILSISLVQAIVYEVPTMELSGARLL